MFRILSRGMVFLVALGFAASGASAALITPGSSGVAASSEPGQPLGGTVIATSTIPFTSLSWPASGFTGTLTSQVISGDVSNPFAGLTFTYLLTSDPASMSDIDRCTINGFDGFFTDMSFDPTVGGTIAPSEVSRSLDGGAGHTVGFTFASPVLSHGNTSKLMVVQTNAPSFFTSTFQMIDGDIASVTTFAPVPIVGTPEPATLSVTGLGVAALLLRRRR